MTLLAALLGSLALVTGLASYALPAKPKNLDGLTWAKRQSA